MEIIQVSVTSPTSRKRHEMEQSAWKGLSIVAVIIIIIGWFLRQRNRWDWPDENYVIRAFKNYYVDPTNLYKYYGSYSKS